MEIEKLVTKITEILDKTYQENYDLQIVTEDSERINYMLYFKFPETVIKNSKNLSMTLHDLYFRIKLKYMKSEGKLTFYGTLSGTRGRLSYKEYLRSYTHSHLDSSGMHGFTNVCLGTSDLNNIISDLSVDCLSSHEFMSFELFANMLYGLAEWESIEGTPYNYIKDVLIYKENENTSESEENAENGINSFLESLADMEWKPDFSFDNELLKFTLIDDEEFEKVITPFTEFHVAKDSNNSFYNPVPTSIKDSLPFVNEAFASFVFRTKAINQEIDGFSGEQVKWPENLPRYANRQFHNAIKNELEYFCRTIFKKLIQSNYDRKEGEFLQKRAYLNKGIKSENLIPVFKD